MDIVHKINDFALRKAKGAFKNIRRADVVAGLRQRVRAPGYINQRGSSLCGPAAFWYCILRRKPHLYVDYVTQMYDQGMATVGALSKAPSGACKDFSPGKRIHPVDWVALASLRDATNLIMNYKMPSNKVGGISYPGDLIRWFREIGYGRGISSTQLFGDFCKHRSHLERACKFCRLGYDVCLLMNHKILENTTNWWSSYPTHWIVLRQVLKLDADRLCFKIFHWGSDNWRVDVKTEDFLRCYYGFVLIGR